MYTRCPTCSTCFRVTERHLAIAKGKVRCGQCQHVFNAPEHAIDDLPTKTTSSQTSNKPVLTEPPAAKTGIKKPVYPSKESKTSTISPKAEEKRQTPDINALNKDDLNNFDLNAPANTKKNFDEKDNLFDDSFDLNAAIDELSHDIEADIIDTEDATPAKQQMPDENSSSNVFSTDAYDANQASSVSDIMDEMEGQLSLNIPEPEPESELEPKPDNEKQYNPDDEFDFIELVNEVEDSGREKEESINIDELFEQVHSSDFQESKVKENIVLDDSNLKNIGQHDPDNENDIPFQLRHDLEHLQVQPKRRLHPLLKFSFIIILLALSFSQLAYFRAFELVNLIPSTRPVLKNLCGKVHCQYSGPMDTKQIQLISRDVRLHPKEKKALLITAVMINNAYFAQPYPNIHIRLSDISGNIVAERVFNAKTYLGKLSEPFLLMKSKTPVHINFEVVDPGRDAVNFEFSFL